MSTLCTQGLFTLIAGAPWEASPCVEDSSGGHKRILVSYRWMFIFIPLFNFHTLNLGIVIKNFLDSMLYEMN
jgi:hypothetical protein